ncbi:glycine-rich domain-containing protein [Allocoleopsis sp.]|uniref:glycine-rich domain-containing protein n=1 Tax=Allocoleopsis sp. TaxID=3088169 RepID=UPI002FD0301B
MSVIKETLSVPALACVEKLKSLDLSSIAAYLMNPQNGYGWTRQRAFCAIRRYKTFLFVSYLYPKISLVPTQDIDYLWHCHILHTRKYRQDCETIFGYFIDHEPNSELWGEANEPILDNAFAQTEALLSQFEGCFEESVLGEAKLPQSLNRTKSQLQEGNDANHWNLHLYRSACGRPNR